MHALILATGLLAGCKGDPAFDLSGVWRFEVAVTPTPEDACSTRLLHNLAGALEDEETGDTGDDGGWLEESEADSSPWTGFGRFVEDGGAWTLFLAGMVLPQEEGGDASQPVFTWQRSEANRQERSHASGYRWVEESEQTAATRLQIAMPNDTEQKDAERSGVPVSLAGSWQEDSSATSSWEEADLWPEELGLGEVGAIPFSSYLTRLDELGYVEAATNERTVVDCTDTYCVLGVNSSCATLWELTATRTSIDPGDEDWEELGWEAGI